MLITLAMAFVLPFAMDVWPTLRRPFLLGQLSTMLHIGCPPCAQAALCAYSIEWRLQVYRGKLHILEEMQHRLSALKTDQVLSPVLKELGIKLGVVHGPYPLSILIIRKYYNCYLEFIPDPETESRP
jgi:hypothetical protein